MTDNSELRIEQRLLGCPFCGEPHVALCRAGERSQVICGTCAVSTATVATEAEAIAAWNTRHMATAEATPRADAEDWQLIAEQTQRRLEEARREVRSLLKRHSATPCADVAKLRKALRRWRDNLAITQTDPVAGEVLHGPALDFVIEQIDLLLASQDTPSTPPSDADDR